MFYSRSKIVFCFFLCLFFVILAIELNLLNIFCNDILIIADRLNPNQLIFASSFIFDFLRHMLSSLFRCIGSIKNSHFMLLSIDKIYQIFKTHLRAYLSDFVALFVFVIEKIALSFNGVIQDGIRSTDHIFSSIISNIEHLRRKAQPIQKTVYLFTNVGLAPSRNQLTSNLRPTIPIITFSGFAL